MKKQQIAELLALGASCTVPVDRSDLDELLPLAEAAVKGGVTVTFTRTSRLHDVDFLVLAEHGRGHVAFAGIVIDD